MQSVEQYNKTVETNNSIILYRANEKGNDKTAIPRNRGGWDGDGGRRAEREFLG